MQRKVIGALAGGLMAWSTAGQASTFFAQTFRCPVGGKSFTATVNASSSSFGQRPDGKRYSTALAPPPECADNGFVFYKEEYSPEEEARLTKLVLSPTYQALRKEAGLHYRQYWLLTQMGEDIGTRAGALIVASWNSSDASTEKVRYQREFVALAETLPPATKDYFWFRAIEADLLRELGEHDRANALMAQLEPTMASLSAEARANWVDFFSKQRALNAERNTASEPTTMVPPIVAAQLCVEAKRPFTQSERTACAAPALQPTIEQFRSFVAERTKAAAR